MAVCQVATNSFARIVVYSSAWHNLKMENAMTVKKVYLSHEPDGTIRQFTATCSIEAKETYYRIGCKGRLFTSVDYEEQPLIYRELRNQRLLEDKRYAVHSN